MEKDKCKEDIKMPKEEIIFELSDTFKVFSDSSRIKIMYALIDGELCVCHIAEKINMSQSAVSHQLRILKNSRLVKARKEGKIVYYSLDDDHVEKILNVVLEHIKEESI